MKRLRFLGTSDILLSVRREVPAFMSTLSFVPSVSENGITRKPVSEKNSSRKLGCRNNPKRQHTLSTSFLGCIKNVPYSITKLSGEPSGSLASCPQRKGEGRHSSMGHHRATLARAPLTAALRHPNP